MDRSDPMTEYFDAHRPATAFDHDSTLVVAMELSGKSWQLGAVVAGVSRRPKQSVKAGDTIALSRILERWKAEAAKAGRTIARVVVAYEAGRDGFWIARHLIERPATAFDHDSTLVVAMELSGKSWQLGAVRIEKFSHRIAPVHEVICSRRISNPAAAPHRILSHGCP